MFTRSRQLRSCDTLEYRPHDVRPRVHEVMPKGSASTRQRAASATPLATSRSKYRQTARERLVQEEHLVRLMETWSIPTQTIAQIAAQKLTVRDLWALDARDFASAANVPLGTALYITHLAKQETNDGAGRARLVQHHKLSMRAGRLDAELLVACLEISKILLRVQRGKRFRDLHSALALPDVELGAEGVATEDTAGFNLFDIFDTAEDALQRRFIDIDADHNGGVSVNELREALSLSSTIGRTRIGFTPSESCDTPDSANSDSEDETTGHSVKDKAFVLFW